MIRVVREVGRAFLAHCPVCGELIRHRPIGETGRARCGGCGEVHRARQGEVEPDVGAESTPRGMPPPPHRRRIPDGVEQQWHDRVAVRGPDGAVAYRADRLLRVGDLVDHPRFGLGEVRKLIPPASAEVHFRQGFKRLRCRL